MVASIKNSKSTLRPTTKRRAKRQLLRQNGYLNWDHLNKKRESMLRSPRSMRAIMNTWKRSRHALLSLWSKSLMLFTSSSSLNANKERDSHRMCIAMSRLSLTSSSKLMKIRFLRILRSSTRKPLEITTDILLLFFLTSMSMFNTGWRLIHWILRNWMRSMPIIAI